MSTPALTTTFTMTACAVALCWGCSSPATPDSICTQMISSCECFSESFRRLCVSTINSYDPTQAELDCAQSQPCTVLCNQSALVAECYVRESGDSGAPSPDAGRDGGTPADGGPSRDAMPPVDGGADAGPAADAAVPCSAAFECGSCTAQAGCGWCRGRNDCVPGTPSGPSGGECSPGQWSATPAECP